MRKKFYRVIHVEVDLCITSRWWLRVDSRRIFWGRLEYISYFSLMIDIRMMVLSSTHPQTSLLLLLFLFFILYFFSCTLRLYLRTRVTFRYNISLSYGVSLALHIVLCVKRTLKQNLWLLRRNKNRRCLCVHFLLFQFGSYNFFCVFYTFEKFSEQARRGLHGLRYTIIWIYGKLLLYSS